MSPPHSSSLHIAFSSINLYDCDYSSSYSYCSFSSAARPTAGARSGGGTRESIECSEKISWPAPCRHRVVLSVPSLQIDPWTFFSWVMTGRIPHSSAGGPGHTAPDSGRVKTQDFSGGRDEEKIMGCSRIGPVQDSKVQSSTVQYNKGKVEELCSGATYIQYNQGNMGIQQIQHVQQ